MRKASLSQARARLSSLVTDAREKGEATVILRRGRPAAAIVPIGLLTPRLDGRPKRRSLSAEQIRRLFAGWGNANPTHSAVADLISSRR